MPAARQPLQSEAVQLALALNYEQHQELKQVFAADSPITDPAIRNRLLRNAASAPLLRQIIAKSTSPSEQHVALYSLLYKDLLRGQYKDYIRDHKLLTQEAISSDLATNADKFTPFPGLDNYGDNPRLALFTWSGKKTDDSYACPATLEIAKLLAKNANDPYGLICLGDFVNENGLDDALRSRDSDQEAAETQRAVLGASADAFPESVFSRGEAYKLISADKKAAPDLKAYALYRAIRCYATSGYNHCGGKEAEKSVRKSWFQTLKKRYASSTWAQNLKYYW